MCLLLSEWDSEERLPGPTMLRGRTDTDGLHHVWRMELRTGRFSFPLPTFTFLRSKTCLKSLIIKYTNFETV